ncbi:hypothetical protein EDB85DRAFT_2059391 [Lactarius pseudohatsudake]|nr:hypothetical protein EDB85DRAFT_2059391 [Lactarius pseudohatsudake]
MLISRVPRSYKCGCSRYCKILRPVSKTTYYDMPEASTVVLQWASGSPALRSSTRTRGTEPLSRTMVNGHTRLDSERGALKEQPHREGPLSGLSSLGLSLSAFLSSGRCWHWRCSCVGRFTVVAILVGVVVVVRAIGIVVAASPLSWPPRRGCRPRCCCIAFIAVACCVVVAAAFAASSWALLVAIIASP